MRYTLTIKDRDDHILVALSFRTFLEVHNIAVGLHDGVAETFRYNIQIYDNVDGRIVYNQNTY